MAVFKCKMCGANLEISENQSVVMCEYCKTHQTLPKIDDEKKLALFNRANNLRLKSEFDKAAGIYESIVAEFSEEAEAYWGLVLCKYGIEYVDDKDGKKIPTCHRTLPTSIMKDTDFEQACENADISAKAVYRAEAKAIDAIQKKILEIAGTEEPYDIFICYKETDDVTGARTEDSSIAQDIYTALTEMGYKVFYARNSLRKVAGTEYEPYIYAALSSAKVMLAIGTKYEYYDAVWVKNEWSRFISMMADNSSKVLIPCYKNMDAYDIPEEFSNMQALDMADMMFFNSLEVSVKRILQLETKAATVQAPTVNTGVSATVDTLLKRVFMFLEDKEWNSANEYCEKVLDINPECADAYLGKLMIDLEVEKKDDLKNCYVIFNENSNYQKFLRFCDNDLKLEIENYVNEIINRKSSLEEELKFVLVEIKKLKQLIPIEEKSFGTKLNELKTEKNKVLDCEIALENQLNIIKELERLRDKTAFFKKKVKEEYTERLDNIEIPKYKELEKIVAEEKQKHLDVINKEIQACESQMGKNNPNYLKLKELYSRQIAIRTKLMKYRCDVELLGIECPLCGEEIFLDNEMLDKEFIECPGCGEELKLDFGFEDCTFESDCSGFGEVQSVKCDMCNARFDVPTGVDVDICPFCGSTQQVRNKQGRVCVPIRELSSL